MENVAVRVTEYAPAHQPWFEKFNRAWIEKYFWMEPIDFDVLQRPEEHIISHGGSILMVSCGNEMAGTVALKRVSEGVYEFTKMAVDEKFQGKKVGKTLAIAAIHKALEMGAHTIILYSSTKLVPALALYRKLGFYEVPVDGPYKRSDIKMELPLTDEGVTIRRATNDDAELIRTLGMRTFRETFEAVNTPEDMQLYLDTSFTLEKIGTELTEPGSAFLLAFHNGEPAGYSRWRTGYEPDELKGKKSFEIERIYAVKSLIGKSIGKKLMGALLNAARDMEFNTVWLGVWEHNPRAIAFYTKYRFETFGAHPFILGTDNQTDLMMKKNLWHGVS